MLKSRYDHGDPEDAAKAGLFMGPGADSSDLQEDLVITLLDGPEFV